jgi:Cysteine-rich secretory protein family
LAAGYSSVEASIAAWYNEISDYNFGDPGFSESTGHFTQVVWVGSTSVGCAWISCNTASTPGYYLMCEYSPAGNVIGEFAQNVLQN